MQSAMPELMQRKIRLQMHVSIREMQENLWKTWQENGEHADVVFMDPPRTGSDKKFMSSVIKLNPSRIVYISCGPETLARDLEYLTKHGYDVRKIQPVDMFSFTDHCENICLLTKKFEKQTKIKTNTNTKRI